MNLNPYKASNWAILFLVSILSFSTLGSTLDVAEDPRAILSRTIDYRFKEPKLLELALTHHSLDFGGSISTRGNERVEFLGDAVLDHVMKMQVLERSYGPQLAELNRNTSLLTQNRSLVRVADTIGLPLAANLPTSLGAGVATVSGRLSALEDAKADLVEALFGAIYLDSGSLAPIETLVRRFWFSAEAPENYSNTVLKPSPDTEDAINKIGYRFKTPWYLSATLGGTAPMESIGKNILKFVINELLYRRFPELPEGELAKKSDFLHAKRNITALPFVGADALEFIGGIYLDGGLNPARQFILWHWTSPSAPEEMRTAIYKAPNTILSESSVIYPMGVKAVIPKSFLSEVLIPLGKTPRFDTIEVSPTPASKFTSKVALEGDGTVISKEAEASTKKDAEKLAAQDALDGLSVKALIDIDSMVLTVPSLDSYLRVLEGFLILKGMAVEYHQLAEHPSGKGIRLEVQGRDLTPIIAEGATKMEAQYHALGYSILQQLENEFVTFQAFPAGHRLELNDWLKFYKRYLEQALQTIESTFEVSPISKAKEKKTPLLTYQINIPARSLLLTGEGYSAEESILDALIKAFKTIKTSSITVFGGGAVIAAAGGAGARA